jgi:hypothetical protein
MATSTMSTGEAKELAAWLHSAGSPGKTIDASILRDQLQLASRVIGALLPLHPADEPLAINEL